MIRLPIETTGIGTRPETPAGFRADEFSGRLSGGN